MGNNPSNEDRESSMGRSSSASSVGRGKSKSLGPNIDLLTQHLTVQNMAALLEFLKRINGEKTLRGAVHKAIESTCSLLNCDRATIFIVDEITDQLVVQDAAAASSNAEPVDIRIPITAGIAGHVYNTGEQINIPDAYQSELFNSEIDKKTGYHTSSILCAPIYDGEGNIVAVLQAINKKSGVSYIGKKVDRAIMQREKSTRTAALSEEEEKTHVPFTIEDETLVDYMAGQVGVILVNAKVYEEAKDAKRKVEAMLDIIRTLHSQDTGVNSVSFTLTERTPLLVEAASCTLYLVDSQHDQLWSLSGGISIRIPKNKGIAGIVACGGEVVNIKDAYKDDRFNKEYDIKSGFHTKTILCLPIFSSDKNNEVVGVLQLINKKHGHFTSIDEELLAPMLSIVGNLIGSSKLFQSTGHGSSKKNLMEGSGGEAGEAVDQLSPTKVTTKFKAMQPFTEAGEDGEEDEDDF